MNKIKRNMSAPESRRFWADIERTAAVVATWPAWRRAGINVRQGGIPHVPECVDSNCLGECAAKKPTDS
jgi:hypothetical protein